MAKIAPQDFFDEGFTHLRSKIFGPVPSSRGPDQGEHSALLESSSINVEAELEERLKSLLEDIPWVSLETALHAAESAPVASSLRAPVGGVSLIERPALLYRSVSSAVTGENDDDGSAGVPELVLEGDLAEMDAGEETCNAPTEEEAIALEEAAAAVKTIGRFLVVSGMALSGTKGALSVERITAEEAKFKVKAIESDYFAFMTLDANPERYPKLLCNRGFPLIRSPRSAQPKHPASAHIWKPEGSLPTSEEATLFVDGHRLQRAGATLPPRRPGRGEGLADEFGGDLCLFGDHITPHDLRQGGLGNCWLISALSAVAEFPEKIRALFIDPAMTLSKSGRYKVRLFEPVDEEWRTYIVDDRFPVNRYGHLRNVRLSVSGELWPAILEKAFAVMFGGYEFLDGGNPYLALKALTGTTGDRLIRLTRAETATNETMSWRCWTPKFANTGFPTARQLRETPWPDSGERGSTPRGLDDLMRMLRWLDRGKSIMCCGSEGDDDEQSFASGVVLGHAYALLEIHEVTADALEKPSGGASIPESFELLKLRNPHGQGGKEWNGAWSDGDVMWERYSHVKESLKPTGRDDGAFWIAKEDFAKEFRSISICISDGNFAEMHKAPNNK